MDFNLGKSYDVNYLCMIWLCNCFILLLCSLFRPCPGYVMTNTKIYAEQPGNAPPAWTACVESPGFLRFSPDLQYYTQHCLRLNTGDNHCSLSGFHHLSGEMKGFLSYLVAATVP